MSPRSKKEMRRTLGAFAIELVLYAIVVTGYFFAVLHFLSGWLAQLAAQHIRLYALVAISLIIGQAILLETLSTTIMRLLRGGRSE